MISWNSYWKGAYNRSQANLYNQFKVKAWPYIQDYGERVLGYRQYKNTQSSLQAQKNYDQYIKAGNERALRDWHRNVPGREIAYPELSYPGQIYRANTSVARAGFDYDTAYSNFIGNVAYRTAGLYNVPTGLYRSL